MVFRNQDLRAHWHYGITAPKASQWAELRKYLYIYRDMYVHTLTHLPPHIHTHCELYQCSQIPVYYHLSTRVSSPSISVDSFLQPGELGSHFWPVCVLSPVVAAAVFAGCSLHPLRLWQPAWGHCDCSLQSSHILLTWLSVVVVVFLTFYLEINSDLQKIYQEREQDVPHTLHTDFLNVIVALCLLLICSLCVCV